MILYIATENNFRASFGKKGKNKKKKNTERNLHWLVFFRGEKVSIALQENMYTEAKQRGSI